MYLRLELGIRNYGLELDIHIFNSWRHTCRSFFNLCVEYISTVDYNYVNFDGTFVIPQGVPFILLTLFYVMLYLDFCVSPQRLTYCDGWAYFRLTKNLSQTDSCNLVQSDIIRDWIRNRHYSNWVTDENELTTPAPPLSPHKASSGS